MKWSINAILRVHSFVIMSLAVTAGVMMAGMFIIIVYDVTIRNLGWGVPVWAVNGTEYALVYVTFLASPWLLRQGGHVYIQTVTSIMSPTVKLWAEKLVCVVCAALCLLLAVRAVGVTIGSFGEVEITQFETPRWLRYWSLPVGFFFLSIEFVRFLFSRESLYGTEQGGL